MKKLFLILIIILFVSCGYHKDKEIYTPFMSNEPIYMVRVWGPIELTNNGCLIIYQIQMKGITDKKIDSINKEADKFIETCIKIKNN